MVKPLIDRTGDVVAERLLEASDQHREVLEWLEGEQVRGVMRRRALTCTLGGWLLVSAAAAVSLFVAYRMAGEVSELFSGVLDSQQIASPMIYAVPIGLAIVAAIVILGGALAWMGGAFPGWSRASTAIDWAGSADAVARLLSSGCTYPEAFRLASSIARTSAIRDWMLTAAQRVEQGASHTASDMSRGDTAVLEAMISGDDQEPARRWRIASNHFFELASRRLTLLLQTFPIITTILSGLLVWISISSTLGWMWRSAADMIRELS